MNRLVDSSYDGKKESFTYDKVGNRLTKTTNHITEKYVYNVKNQLKEIHHKDGVSFFTFDKQGNTLKEETAQGTNSFEYNTLNQQVKAITKDGNTLVNRFDAEGLRYEIEENEKLTKFIFHNDEVLVETDESDKPISRFIRGYDVVAADVKDGRYYYSVDEQGSTEFITDVAGKVRNEYRYDVFGNVREAKENIHNRITYTGQQFDNVTNQYYLRARFYNPVIGRFTQEDEYRGDGLNLYVYCGNNPVIYYDPSGYSKVCPKRYSSLREQGYTAKEAYDIAKGRISQNSIKPNPKNVFNHNVSGYYFKPGNANYKGKLPKKGWRLTPKGQGAHLVEKVNVKDRPGLQCYNKKTTPRFYSYGSARNAGEAHKRLHKATKKAGIRLQGGNSTLSDKELINAYKKAYQDPELHGIRGDLRTPNGKIVIATNVSPSKAIKLLVEWARTQE